MAAITIDGNFYPQYPPGDPRNGDQVGCTEFATINITLTPGAAAVRANVRLVKEDSLTPDGKEKFRVFVEP